MAKSFTWERGPFEQCPRCREQTFGFLSAGRDVMTLRCAKCHSSHGEVLPEVDKATIYLDQFIFSSIFKIKAGGRAPLGHQDFYDELIPLLRRVVLLQQALHLAFPTVDIGAATRNSVQYLFSWYHVGVKRVRTGQRPGVTCEVSVFAVGLSEGES